MGKKKILFVDDEAAILRWFKLALERTDNYEVATEQKGQEALRTARAFQPDMIFIDLNMPVVEGSVVAYEIKADPSFAKTPIVFLTGVVSAEEVSSTGGKIGGQSFLAKPINLAALVNCIENHLS